MESGSDPTDLDWRHGRGVELVGPSEAIAMALTGRRLSGEPFTMAVRALVERLDEQGPQTVPQLTAWLDVTRQAVQRVADDARALGYVEVRDNPVHRRSHLITLTAQGQDALRRRHEDELAALATVAAGIDRADLLTCAAVLTRFTEDLAGRARG